KKEIWIYKNNEKDNAKPNLGERDVRMFENISPDKSWVMFISITLYNEVSSGRVINAFFMFYNY
nr:type III effector [Escherichia coli]